VLVVIVKVYLLSTNSDFLSSSFTVKVATCLPSGGVTVMVTEVPAGISPASGAYVKPSPVKVRV